MRVDHVGIAVETIEAGEQLLLALGCDKIHEEVSEDGQFRWATYVLGDASRLELVAPEPGTESFLTAFLDDDGPGLHHVTLEVADIDAAITGLEAAGVDVVDRAAFDHWAEAYVSPRNPTGALIMEYFDGYANHRDAADRLFVRGEPLGGRSGSSAQEESVNPDA
jgi:methylmalonyl-CoA/ethylmalonyl-CoA epimerase